ncbi:MAG TPA: hypothetical protein VFH68_10035 [Polyangia bacterium]|nr:hypothetical protein [Polyangia bacterium]
MRAPSSRTLITAAAAVAVFAIAVAPFFWSITFFTDDHLLLAFARYTPNPLAAFGHDLHGGEFYRPLSMSLWWLLARLGGGTIWPFAVLAAALHLLVAMEVAWLLLALGGGRTAAWSAAAFFWLSPQTREAALWAAAFPDLLGTALVLGALLALLRGRRVAAIGFGACAFLTKESAIVLPLLALLMLIGRNRGRPAVEIARRWEVSILGALAAGYLLARWRVLGGWGGTGDERAPLTGRLLQISSGLIHVVTGTDVFPEALAWGAGVAVLGVALLAVWRTRKSDAAPPAVLAPVAFIVVAVLPLFAVGWIVGARYFYLPAVGLAWLVGQALARAGAAWRVGGFLFMVVLGGVQTLARHDDVAAYDRRVEAARRAVIDGVDHGHRVFHIAGGIKDLDLAVKESPALRAAEDRLLILGDVPASFVAIPPELESAAAILVAAPPLPPSGAYHFGARRVVGLARRGDEPTLDEVIARFPDLRLLRLRLTPGGRVIARDVTQEVGRSLDAGDADL